MSDALAIVAVTKTVHRLLLRAADAALPGTAVTTKSLDKARDGVPGPQLNLFLYHTAIDPAWRNMDMPGVRNGEVGFPPLPLTLHYLVTGDAKTLDIQREMRTRHRLSCAVGKRALCAHPWNLVEGIAPLSNPLFMPCSTRLVIQSQVPL